jgi:lipopolysaccharide/colanic/teichoic acid biosynthesis glycosyltransferase
MNRINNFFKRIFDISASLIGLIILSPFLVIIAILVKVTSKGPVFFKQIRVGKNKKLFKILKFRTMIENAEAVGKQITVGGDIRITKIGGFIRKYKFDELPQLINVFKGDMSLVGPRPEVPKYVNLYTEKQYDVFMVRPGITDLASIRYCDENELLGSVDDPEEFYINTIMQDKLKLNMEYICQNNVFFDVYIIFKTILKCFHK